MTANTRGQWHICVMMAEIVQTMTVARADAVQALSGTSLLRTDSQGKRVWEAEAWESRKQWLDLTGSGKASGRR